MSSKCPTCNGSKEESIDINKYFPFCSYRCKMVDLYKWLNEEYSIPGDNMDMWSEEDSLN